MWNWIFFCRGLFLNVATCKSNGDGNWSRFIFVGDGVESHWTHFQFPFWHNQIYWNGGKKWYRSSVNSCGTQYTKKRWYDDSVSFNSVFSMKKRRIFLSITNQSVLLIGQFRLQTNALLCSFFFSKCCHYFIPSGYDDSNDCDDGDAVLVVHRPTLAWYPEWMFGIFHYFPPRRCVFYMTTKSNRFIFHVDKSDRERGKEEKLCNKWILSWNRFNDMLQHLPI